MGRFYGGGSTITLFSHHLTGSQLKGLPSWATVEAVGHAMRAMPGAGWVDVEDAGGALPETLRHRSPLERFYAAGSSAPSQDPEWDALRQRIEAAITRALAGEEPDEPPPMVVHSAPAGLRRWFRSQHET